MSTFAPNTGLPNGFYRTFQVSEDMDGKEGYQVTVGADGRVAITADGKESHGVITDVTETGATGKVEVQLTAPVAYGITGAAFNEGAILVCDTNGKLTATAATGDRVVGIAIEAADSGESAAYIPVAAPVLAL